MFPDLHVQASLAAVDVIPLFLETVYDFPLDDKDLIISFLLSENEIGPVVPVVHIQHALTGICVQSSGITSPSFLYWIKENIHSFYEPSLYCR